MKPAENIEKLVKKLRYQSSDERRKRIFDNVATVLDDKQKRKPAIIRPNVWRIIMKTRITKLAAAAVIIIAVFLAINEFGVSIDGTSVALAQVREAMEKINWLRGTSEGLNGVTEQWYAFESKIEIIKELDGQVKYLNYGGNRKYLYEPSSQTITISYLPDDEFALGTTAPFALLDRLVKQEQERGATLTQTTGRYEGITVEIWEVVRSEEKSVEKIKIFVDYKRLLPIAAEVKYTGSDGEKISEHKVKFEYPEAGPKDIYELGVPTSVKVVDTVEPQFK